MARPALEAVCRIRRGNPTLRSLGVRACTLGCLRHFFFEVLYRPHYSTARLTANALLLLALVGFNGYLQYRLRTKRPTKWQWFMTPMVLDVVGVSVAVAISGGFSHYVLHLFYYPALAGFALLFISFRLNMVWVTIVAVTYTKLSLPAGEGLNIEAREEEALVARIGVMYAVVVMVNLAGRFERMRWRQSVERERETYRDRVDLSRTIHDTVAQTAYMVGLGVDRARKLAGDSEEELTAALDATADMSKSVIWELRRPLDGGQVYEGAWLGAMINSHARTFTAVTSVPVEAVMHGVEPELATEVRNRLFSIAHNALTNAFRHSRAGYVEVVLEFSRHAVRLSVSDYGAGLPGDYARRGLGFAGMKADVEAIGGRLIVETTGKHGGATVTCVVSSSAWKDGDHG